MDLSLQTFLPHKDSIFIIQTQAGAVELTLTEVSEGPRGNRPERFRTPLSLIFVGSAKIAMLQDNYHFSHPELGEHVWCMVPVSGPPPGVEDGTPREYQVVFN